MTNRPGIRNVLCAGTVVLGIALGISAARADGNLNNVNHIIVVMQENHSFDNYFGHLPYVPTGPYHVPTGPGTKRNGCPAADSTCVDGLNCKLKRGVLVCRNHNPSNLRGGSIKAFHETRYCTGPDLEHGWVGSHQEGNFKRPNDMLRSSPNNGFVKVNAETQQPDQVTAHDTMGYYTEDDLPFYYDIAQTFAISDRYFAAVIGQTFPNRAYFMAGTSFGHLTTNELLTPGGYKPITGSIFDLLDAAGISWANYRSDLAYSLMFEPVRPEQKPIAQFASDAAAGTLAKVVFVDPSALHSQTINGTVYQTDEHPPNNIRAGQYFVSQIIGALRNSQSWNDSLLIFTYDEHGGFYDHVAPPPAPQGGASTPDGIAPGLCADDSNPPASHAPGGGVHCAESMTIAQDLCPNFDPNAPYPSDCATFNQLGFRLPFVAVSPFSKPHYVSHVVASHPSILALIEKRFSLPSLTARDANAGTLEDLFDFDTSPSLNAAVGTAPLPMQPPAQSPGDPGCPF